MPFAPELVLGLGAPYYDEDGRAYVVDFQLGYESNPAQEIAQSILMSVILFEDDLSSALELCFGIRKENVFPPHKITGLEETDYEADTARRYVPAESRERVLNLVIQATESLVEMATASAVIMHTHHRNLPPRAMGKYYRVVNELGHLGYVLFEYERGTNDGIDHWFFNIRH